MLLMVRIRVRVLGLGFGLGLGVRVRSSVVGGCLFGRLSVSEDYECTVSYIGNVKDSLLA